MRRPSIPYIAPFVAFLVMMALERTFSLPVAFLYPLRVLVVCAVLFAVSRPVVSLRASLPWGSVAIGIGVFLIWIGPDVLIGPTYRQHWLFHNPLMGEAISSAPEHLKRSILFMAIRMFGCVAVVPLIEELFWRGWLMRWLVNPEFQKVPIGAYSAMAFWSVAVLFASEHGPYWEVGLLTGMIYNWWVIRTRNLADAIIAHTVTNLLLSIFVLLTGQWQYWL